jgi:hypothetical protein
MLGLGITRSQKQDNKTKTYVLFYHDFTIVTNIDLSF